VLPGLAGPAGDDVAAGRAFVTATIKDEPVAAGKPIVRRHVVVWNDVHQGQSAQSLFPLRRWAVGWRLFCRLSPGEGQPIDQLG
jgi:hypothetical protein